MLMEILGYVKDDSFPGSFCLLITCIIVCLVINLFLNFPFMLPSAFARSRLENFPPGYLTRLSGMQ